MAERVFWFDCKYSDTGAKAVVKVVDEALGDCLTSSELLTESGKIIPRKLYNSLKEVLDNPKLKALEYTEVDSAKHTTYAASQQGFFYDPEKDDPEEVHAAKLLVSVVAATPCLKAIENSREALNKAESVVAKAITKVGKRRT